MNDKALKSKFLDDDFYLPLLRSFSEDLEGVYEKLESQVNNENFKALREHCHQMSGASSTYGYPQLALLFEEVETLVLKDKHNKEVLQEYLSQFSSMFDKVRAGIC